MSRYIFSLPSLPPFTPIVDGLPGRKFQGRVSEIGRYAEFATQRDVVRGREDIKTFRVKVRVDDPGGFLKPGMTVEVMISKQGKYFSLSRLSGDVF